MKSKRNEKNLKNLYIFVVRLMNEKDELGNHKLGNSKPCRNCETNLYKNGIERIYYTDVGKNQIVIKELRLKI
jgi:hypothetical protein